MNPKKQKAKDRRRARKLAEQAWEAVDTGNLDPAEKIVRRAVAAQMDNPMLWVDQGLILALRGKEADAADAFRAAISRPRPLPSRTPTWRHPPSGSHAR